REGNNFIKFALNLGSTHAEDRAIEEDVFASGQFWMETGSDLEQTGDAPPQCDTPFVRLGNLAQNLQQGGFSSPIAADDAENLALLDFEAHILQRPEFLDVVALNDLSSAHEVGRFARKVSRLAADDVAQGGIAFALARLMADEVALRKVLDPDRGVGHQIRSAKLFSIWRKRRNPSHRNSAVTARLRKKPGR